MTSRASATKNQHDYTPSIYYYYHHSNQAGAFILRQSVAAATNPLRIGPFGSQGVSLWYDHDVSNSEYPRIIDLDSFK